MLSVAWGNDLEQLADRLFASVRAASRVGDPGDVLSRRPVVVVPNRVVQGWLGQRYLLDAPRDATPHVLANWEFPLLHVFVNDSLHRMQHPETPRQPLHHPFSAAAMRWRILEWLETIRGSREPALAPLQAYLRPHGPDGLQAFALAGRLAALLDEYQVYRPDVLTDWESLPDPGRLPADQQWQAALWRHLTADGRGRDSYLAALRRMDALLPRSRLAAEWPLVAVFGVSLMPVAYLAFFAALGSVAPVELYLLNPCCEQWDEDLSPRRRRSSGDRSLVGAADAEHLADAGHPLLTSMGKGCQAFLAGVLDVTEGQIEDAFQVPAGATVLGALQRSIVTRSPAPEAWPDDDTVQVHLCHSPVRELEVLRDRLLRWFSSDGPRPLQPRHVQVQVTDLATYAPLIDAVFGSWRPYADETIPYVVADRVTASECMVSQSFLALLEVAEGRFTASAVMDLLQCAAIAEAFDIGQDTLPQVREWVRRAGILWGRDARHRAAVACVTFTEATTWRRGLDRLLLGYAMRPEEGEQVLPTHPAEAVEGPQAGERLGHLVRYVETLEELCRRFATPATPAEWAERLHAAIDRFFASTNATFRDIRSLHDVADQIAASSAGASVTVPLAGVRTWMSEHLSSTLGGAAADANAVIFCGLRPGSSTPRPIVCLLGMGDGIFPRSDNRPAYDLLRRERRRGDRSLRREDRAAFLEALLSARRRFYISYVGFTEHENERLPPSTLVAELGEFLTPPQGQAAWKRVVHRLQAFHPVYFEGRDPFLFSYSSDDCAAAVSLCKAGAETCPSPLPGSNDTVAAPLTGTLDIQDLTDFLRNPAKHYCTRVLGVRLTPGGEQALRDEESFDPDALDSYHVHARIIAACVAGADEHRLRQLQRELADEGLVPLACWGERWFEERVQAIASCLQQGDTIAGCGSLAEALAAERTDHDIVLDLGSGCPAVSGRVTLVGADAAVDFRYAGRKARDELTGWCHHLLASAAGHPHRRWIVGRKGPAPDVLTVAPLEPGQAAGLLRGLVELYREGRTRPLPFAPETSRSYVRALRSKGADDEARSAARRTWSSTFDAAPGEIRDVYLRHCFGNTGPVADDRFAAVACAVFEPILSACQPT